MKAKVAQIPESEYVTVKDGHLSLRGKRVRFWGAIGALDGKQKTIKGDPYYVQRRNAERIRDMGFNIIRFWHYGSGEYTKGDLSKSDLVDFFLAECKKQGIYVWGAGLGGGGVLYTNELEGAAKIIDDPKTEAAWKTATAQLAKPHYRHKEKVVRIGKSLACVWDPRLEALFIRNMKRSAQHLNQHTGLRFCDDPQNAIWEITNEQWWPRRMVSAAWQKLPAFFQKSLTDQWNAFLKKKYGSEAKLKAAWLDLLPGESLKEKSILLAPLGPEQSAMRFNDTNPQALAALKGLKQKFSRDDFNFQRGADVMEFFTQLLVAHKQRIAKQVKTWGRSCKLSPLIYDTGIGYNAQSQYMHQQADAVCHGGYMEGFTFKDPTHKRYPFYSGLDMPPRVCKDVPWMEHNKVEGKPFFVYETQVGNPNKYRAEYPLRIAALGAIQDWDAVCWHYWHLNQSDYEKDEPHTGKLSFPGPGAHQYVYSFDEVHLSALKAAGTIFRQGLVKPAPQPTKYIYGRKSLYDPAGMDYAGCYGKTGWNMLDTTYRYGVRIELDPTREDDEVVGPQILFNGFDKPCPIKPNDQIEFDYQKAHLIFDSPGAMSYVGFFAQYGNPTLTFQNGATLTDIKIVNPKGSPYPVTDDEKYLAFTLACTTGRSLKTTKKAMISLVSTSFNSGLKLDPKLKRQKYGTEPVLVTRVGATVECPAIAGMNYVFRDFQMRDVGQGTATNGVLKIPADKPIFVVELSR